jgi:Holliday junction resolvase RusA-like endonuclease
VAVIEFAVPGKPFAKQRPRFSRYSGTAYTPKATGEAESYIRECFYKSIDMGFIKYRSPVHVSLTACYEVPKSASKANKELMLSGKTLPDKRNGDLDNIIKLYLDALNGCAYEDDCQVVSIHANKIYAAEPLVLISINEID